MNQQIVTGESDVRFVYLTDMGIQFRKQRVMKLKVVGAGVLLLFIMAACSPPPVLRDPDVLNDTSLVSGEPCSAPCFQGITPGVTRWNEAVTLVEDSALFSNSEIKDADDGPTRALEFNTADTNKRCCGVYSDDGQIVTSIFVLVAPDNTLGEVIAKYGEPSYLTAESISDDQASVAVVYPDVPMILYVFAAGMETGSLSADSEIFGHVYMTADGMRRALSGSSLYAWTGYNTVAQLTSGELATTPLPEGVTPEPEMTAEATAETGS